MAKRNRKRSKKWLPYSFIFIGSTVLAVLLYSTVPVLILEQGIVDEFFVQRGSLDVSESPIILVDISQTADEEISYKWPTELHARLVKNLNRAGAKVIGFDVIFDNADIYSSANDSLFADAMKKYKNVFLAGDIKADEGSGGSNRSLVLPHSVLNEGNPNPIGLVETLKEVDGKVRRYTFGRAFNGDTTYTLAFEMLRYLQGLNDEPFINTEKEFGIGEYIVEKNTPNSFLINFHGPTGIFPSVSYEKVIDDSTFKTVFEAEAFDINDFDNPDGGLLQQGIFKDKIVLVGATMLALQDYHRAPFSDSESVSGQLPGYEIHANALQSILSGNFIQRMNGFTAFLFILLFSGLVVFVNRTVSYKIGIPFSVLLIVSYFAVGYMLFVEQSYFIVFVGPTLGILFSQIGTTGYEYLDTRKEKARIQNMFQSYVSPKLVTQMIESEEEPSLGGEEQVVTAFFSDIASFSAFSEKLPPVRLVALINEYLSAMTNILTDEGGTLDKYIGDAIVAIFGAPVQIKNHAYQACLVSQLMQLKQQELREKWAKEDWPDIVANMRTRIGLNTGEMVTGNMGSNRRFNYTMMGDNVNLAARAESGR